MERHVLAEKLFKTLTREEFNTLQRYIIHESTDMAIEMVKVAREDKERREDPIESIVLFIIENQVEFAQKEWGDYYINQHGVREYMDLDFIADKIMSLKSVKDRKTAIKRMLELEETYGERLMEYVVMTIVEQYEDDEEDEKLEEFLSDHMIRKIYDNL